MHLKLADSVFIHPKLSGFIRDIGGAARFQYPHGEWSCKFPITCAQHVLDTCLLLTG